MSQRRQRRAGGVVAFRRHRRDGAIAAELHRRRLAVAARHRAKRRHHRASHEIDVAVAPGSGQLGAADDVGDRQPPITLQALVAGGVMAFGSKIVDGG